jgi:hypothetical protein
MLLHSLHVWIVVVMQEHFEIACVLYTFICSFSDIAWKKGNAGKKYQRTLQNEIEKRVENEKIDKIVYFNGYKSSSTSLQFFFVCLPRRFVLSYEESFFSNMEAFICTTNISFDATDFFCATSSFIWV